MPPKLLADPGFEETEDMTGGVDLNITIDQSNQSNQNNPNQAVEQQPGAKQLLVSVQNVLTVAQRSEERATAAAAADVTAAKQQVAETNQRLRDVDTRFAAMEKNHQDQLAAVERRTEERLAAVERRTEERLAAMEKRHREERVEVGEESRRFVRAVEEGWNKKYQNSLEGRDELNPQSLNVANVVKQVQEAATKRVRTAVIEQAHAAIESATMNPARRAVYGDPESIPALLAKVALLESGLQNLTHGETNPPRDPNKGENDQQKASERKDLKTLRLEHDQLFVAMSNARLIANDARQVAHDARQVAQTALDRGQEGRQEALTSHRIVVACLEEISPEVDRISAYLFGPRQQ